jgi:hypothetical protein
MLQLRRRRSIGISLAVLAVGLLAGGCDWYGFGNGSQNNGDNAFDTSITPANVSTLSAQFSATDGAPFVIPQAVVNGILYVDSTVNGLEAYSASGTSGCSGSPAVCAPLWSYADSVGLTGIMVTNGAVYLTAPSGVEAFDASGQTNCSGTPTVCQPLWTASGTFSPVTVANGTVYVTSSDTLDAFDESGSQNCSGAPKVCKPIWTASNAFGTVTVSAGIAYVESNVTESANGGGFVGFDANGIQGCSGSPKVCTPVRQYATNYPVNGGGVVASGSSLYVATLYVPMPRQLPAGDIEAFDANGKVGCGGILTTCTPIWTNPAVSPGGSLLVGDGSVFETEPGTFGIGAVNINTGEGEFVLSAVNGLSAQAIGGSVFYAVDSNRVNAYDAGGSSGCSGSSPPTCTPLWSVPGTNAIVANGIVYVSTTNPSGGQKVVAYGLPSSS